MSCSSLLSIPNTLSVPFFSFSPANAYLFLAVSSPPFSRPLSFPPLSLSWDVMSMTYAVGFAAARRCLRFLVLFHLPDSFSALMLLVERQEEHPRVL